MGKGFPISGSQHRDNSSFGIQKVYKMLPERFVVSKSCETKSPLTPLRVLTKFLLAFGGEGAAGLLKCPVLIIIILYGLNSGCAIPLVKTVTKRDPTSKEQIPRHNKVFLELRRKLSSRGSKIFDFATKSQTYFTHRSHIKCDRHIRYWCIGSKRTR